MISKRIGPDAAIIEPGCGNCEKIRYLLPHLKSPAAYIAMDISKEYLLKTARALENDFPNLSVSTVVSDYTEDFMVPRELTKEARKKVIFFPGSTIGNLNTRDAKRLIRTFWQTIGQDGGLLIGVDLKKESDRFRRAYNDEEGITARFKMNILERCNRELNSNFDLENFEHLAFYDANFGRVEMHLVRKAPQSVWVANQLFHFGKKESIHTESSYKYSLNEFTLLARSVGFERKDLWVDHSKSFCVYYFERLV